MLKQQKTMYLYKNRPGPKRYTQQITKQILAMGLAMLIRIFLIVEPLCFSHVPRSAACMAMCAPAEPVF